MCNDCMQARSLARHKATKHKIDTAAITQQMTPSHFAEHGNTYEISMPEYKHTGQCPVPGCDTIIKDRYSMHHHFLFWHTMIQL
jgi:hypothetical protein